MRERIAIEGALSFHDWMEAALYDERDGYYSRADSKRWGREGDYRTSPERSSLFARTFARFFASVYEEMGRPRELTILEAGAGAGHFASGVLETFKESFPEIFHATRYVIDERSHAARSLIQERLASDDALVECRSLFDHPTISEACIVFANELLDAFPVHRVVMREGRLLELFVETNSTGEFVFTERPLATPRITEYLERLNLKLSEGQLIEVNLRAVDWLKRASTLFTRGYLILVDYGAEAAELYDARLRPTGSLRAFRRHSFVQDVLRSPGQQDLTTTIDWTTVKRVCRESGLEIVSFERQDAFLLRAGILEELSRMTAQSVSNAESLALAATAREMILPGGMSESFQVLAARK